MVEKKSGMAYENVLGKWVRYVIDRPLGSRHPDYPALCYPVNYGYVADEIGGDGEAQDIYLLGVEEPVQGGEGQVIAVIRRLDDAEDKWVVAPKGAVFTREEIFRATHFQERYFTIEVYCLQK